MMMDRIARNRVGWMTPENFQKYFNFEPTEYMEIHVHSVLVRNRNMENRGFYNPTFAPVDEVLNVEPFYEVGISIRDPSDHLMMKVMDDILTMDAARMQEFINDLLPMSQMARILYANEPEVPSRKRRKGK